MDHSEQHMHITRGLAALNRDDTLEALMHFEHADRLGRTPLTASCLGYCLAREQRQLQQGLSLCFAALRQEAGNPLLYLNLARVHLLAGQRLKAITVLQKGHRLRGGEIVRPHLTRLGLRKAPVFKSLPRDHPLNKYGGKLLARIGLR